MAIVAKAVQTNNEKELVKLDLMIHTAKTLIKNLLSIEVPQDAVVVHLGLLNTSSTLLSNLEAMRVTFSDPVKGFVGASQYVEHLNDFLSAVKDTRVYFDQKL